MEPHRTFFSEPEKDWQLLSRRGSIPDLTDFAIEIIDDVDPNVPILFLDFDGVLNNTRWNYHGGRSNVTEFDPKSIAALNEIIERTGAKVVLATAWRLQMDFEAIKLLLKMNGFKGEVIGKTPTVPFVSSENPSYARRVIKNHKKENEQSSTYHYVQGRYTGSVTFHDPYDPEPVNEDDWYYQQYLGQYTSTFGWNRGGEIQAWLDARPSVTNWLIIDDDTTGMSGKEHRFINTVMASGLGPEHIERAVAILGRDTVPLYPRNFSDRFNEALSF